MSATPKPDVCPETCKALFKMMSSAEAGTGKRHSKVSIVGVGSVGMACAYAVLNQGLCAELALVDCIEDKVRGEVMDLQQGGGADYVVTADSDLIVITAGARQKPGESRLDLVGRNLSIFKNIIPNLMKHNTRPNILVVSNPCDIMSWITWKLSGLPPHHVFGSGTALDSSRFRGLVAERLGVDTRSVHGYIVGEHGDSSVAVWSNLNIGGIRLQDVNAKIGTDDDPENWTDLHQRVIRAAYEVIQCKGYTNWAIGMTVASIVEAVLRNEHRVLPVSTLIKGAYGVGQEVYLSVPSVVCIDGVREMLTLKLSEPEQAKLGESATAIWNVQKELDMSM